MRVEKASKHAQFDSWVETIIAQPGMKKKLNDLANMRAITQARKMTMDWKLADLEFLMSSGVLRLTPSSWLGGFGPMLEDVSILSQCQYLARLKLPTS